MRVKMYLIKIFFELGQRQWFEFFSSNFFVADKTYVSFFNSFFACLFDSLIAKLKELLYLYRFKVEARPLGSEFICKQQKWCQIFIFTK